MSWYSDESRFDPNRDSKMPVKRGVIWTPLRAAHGFLGLICTRHPSDALLWLRSMIARRRPLSMPIPWLTFGAIRAIKQNLPNNPAIFEFGSGHSTVYWAKLGATVVSVEDNEEWHALLQATLDRSGLRGSVRLLLAQTRDNYVGAVRTCPLESQDLILVDGAYRRDCVTEAIPHVKPGGMLVVDNTDWHWFKNAPLEGIPVNWVRTSYPGLAPMLGHATETSIWVRPHQRIEK